MQWIFGDYESIDIFKYKEDEVEGSIDYKKATVCFYLSTKGNTANRSLKLDFKEIEFSKGFTDLHTLSYKNIINGNGFGIEDARPSIKICERITQQITNYI
jgi:UDP-N-acetyl-2-amino-2-deoxyglucuronate dehydrogenase